MSKRPHLSAHRSPATRARARLRHLHCKRACRPWRCSVLFFFCLPASSVHAKPGFPQPKVASGSLWAKGPNMTSERNWQPLSRWRIGRRWRALLWNALRRNRSQKHGSGYSLSRFAGRLICPESLQATSRRQTDGALQKCTVQRCPVALDCCCLVPIRRP